MSSLLDRDAEEASDDEIESEPEDVDEPRTSKKKSSSKNKSRAVIDSSEEEDEEEGKSCLPALSPGH